MNRIFAVHAYLLSLELSSITNYYYQNTLLFIFFFEGYPPFCLFFHKPGLYFIHILAVRAHDLQRHPWKKVKVQPKPPDLPRCRQQEPTTWSRLPPWRRNTFFERCRQQHIKNDMLCWHWTTRLDWPSHRQATRTSTSQGRRKLQTIGRWRTPKNRASKTAGTLWTYIICRSFSVASSCFILITQFVRCTRNYASTSFWLWD